MTATEPQLDGRHARRDRNRTAVVDAMIELYRDGNYEPSSDEIAARAGLSPRSLFRYFDDLDDLVRTAIARQLETVLPFANIDLDVQRPLAERIEGFLRSRLRVYDKIEVAARVARARALTQPLLAEQVAQARKFWRDQLAAVFAPELARADASDETLAAIDVLTSFESVQHLREQGLGRARLEAALARALTRMLED